MAILMTEQELETPEKETAPEIPPEEAPPEETIPETPEAMEPGMTPGMDPSMAGMGGVGMGMPEEKEYTDEYIGRVYELKKIFSRLQALSSFLDLATDRKLLKLKSYISSALELFAIVTSNLDSFKDRMDDIIISFYKFLKYAYALLKAYYEKQAEEEK